MLIFLTETLTSHFPQLNPFHAGDRDLCTSLVGSVSTADQKEPGDSIDETVCVTTTCSCSCHPSPCRLDSLDTGVSPDWAWVGWTARIMYRIQLMQLQVLLVLPDPLASPAPVPLVSYWAYGGSGFFPGWLEGLNIRTWKCGPINNLWGKFWPMRDRKLEKNSR